MSLNSHVLIGFRSEIEKIAVSSEMGLKGLAIGAALGAGLTYMSADKLEDVVSQNKTMAMIAGALIGAGVLGGAGYLLGKAKPATPQAVGGPKISPRNAKAGFDSNKPPAWY